MLRRFRGRSLKLDKKTSDDQSSLETPTAPYCHSCGQRTPQQSTFAGLEACSPRSPNRSSWPHHHTQQPQPRPLERTYGSFASTSSTSSSSSSSSSGSTAGDSLFDVAPAPPARQGTYSSSVYSSDDSTDHEGSGVEPFPVIVEQCYDYEFDLPPRTLSTYSERFKPKSRYAKLNELPAASPRSSLFPEDVYDLDAGIERTEAKGEGKKRRNRLSVSLRRLSVASLRKS